MLAGTASATRVDGKVCTWMIAWVLLQGVHFFSMRLAGHFVRAVAAAVVEG